MAEGSEIDVRRPNEVACSFGKTWVIPRFQINSISKIYKYYVHNTDTDSSWGTTFFKSVTLLRTSKTNRQVSLMANIIHLFMASAASRSRLVLKSLGTVGSDDGKLVFKPIVSYYYISGSDYPYNSDLRLSADANIILEAKPRPNNVWSVKGSSFFILICLNFEIQAKPTAAAISIELDLAARIFLKFTISWNLLLSNSLRNFC